MYKEKIYDSVERRRNSLQNIVDLVDMGLVDNCFDNLVDIEGIEARYFEGSLIEMVRKREERRLHC